MHDDGLSADSFVRHLGARIFSAAIREDRDAERIQELATRATGRYCGGSDAAKSVFQRLVPSDAPDPLGQMQKLSTASFRDLVALLEARPTRELIAIKQMADLCQVEVKTIHNKKSEAKKTDEPFPEPVEPGNWRYADVRPVLLEWYPALSHRLPESYSNAMKILAGQTV